MSEHVVIEQCSRWGWMKWQVWLAEADFGWRDDEPQPSLPSCLRLEGEYGTYAWTYKQAQRKGERLLRYTARRRAWKADENRRGPS